MRSNNITSRWLRGSLLITAAALAVAVGLFLYSSYQSLYGGVQQAMVRRFTAIDGRLQATGTAGDARDTAASRGLRLP